MTTSELRNTIWRLFFDTDRLDEAERLVARSPPVATPPVWIQDTATSRCKRAYHKVTGIFRKSHRERWTTPYLSCKLRRCAMCHDKRPDHFCLDNITRLKFSHRNAGTKYTWTFVHSISLWKMKTKLANGKSPRSHFFLVTKSNGPTGWGFSNITNDELQAWAACKAMTVENYVEAGEYFGGFTGLVQEVIG